MVETEGANSLCQGKICLPNTQTDDDAGQRARDEDDQQVNDPVAARRHGAVSRPSRRLGGGAVLGSGHAHTHHGTRAIESVRERSKARARARPVKNASLAIVSQPTLRRTWPGDCPRPQCAFEVSMIYVFCNSH